MQSSLYYLHVAGPKDEELLNDTPPEGSDTVTVSEAPLSAPASSVLRKPLPPSPIAAGSVQNPGGVRPLPPTPPELPRRPQADDNYNFPMANQNQPTLSVLTPREDISSRHNAASGRYLNSINPPSPGNVLPNGCHTSPSIRNLEQLVHKSNENHRHLEEILNELQIETTAGAQGPRRQSKEDVRPPLPKRSTAQSSIRRRSSEEGTYLTLIRRDPSTNQQWNVANVADPPVFAVSSDKQRTKTSGQPMYLSITNPGYSKFTRSATPRTSIDGSVASRTPSNSSESTVTGDTIFERRLWMEGSTFKSSVHRKSASADSPFRPSPSSLATSQDSLRLSTHSAPTMHTLSLSGTPRSKTKGYTFLSPWQGRCEFSASTVGGSLKCRHSFLSPYLSVDGRNEPTLVSELRFNLPGGGPLASTPASTPGSEGGASSVRISKHHRARDLFRLHGRGKSESTISISDYGGEEDRLDLSLGQELAGGGFAGKRAKLGKLIVEGEGCKMLDLLVVANMAVWWRAWDKA